MPLGICIFIITIKGLHGLLALIGPACSGAVLCAQAYIPMLDSTAAWQDESAWASPGPNTSNYECLRYTLHGDSVVDGLTYKMLRRWGHISHTDQVLPSLSWTQWYAGDHIGLLREDTAARRVFIRPPGATFDLLLYDFSVGVGPYPSTFRFYGAEGLEVIEVDTIMLADGPHRRLRFNNGDDLIEGVGAVSGFLASWSSGEIGWMRTLVCHTRNDSTIYSGFTLDCPCSPTVGLSPARVSGFRVGPSPTNDLCYITAAPANASYRVSTLDGRVIGSGSCTHDGSTVLDLSGLPAAIYLVEVAKDDQRLYSRIIKQ